MRRCHPATRVFLIEQTGDFGPGHAYGTSDPAHLLNVPAASMGALPGDPGHFLAWVRAQPGHEGAGESGFLPRRLYGAYLRQLLAEAAVASGPTLQRLTARVTALADPATLTLLPGRAASGFQAPSTLHADAVILATGNIPPLPPHGIDPTTLPPGAYAPDPWSADALAGLPPDAPVALLGAGLTTADAVLSLLDAGHRGPIHILSRHGLLPRTHAAVPAPPPTPDLPRDLPSRLLPLLRQLRRTIRAGVPWRVAVDQLHPCTAQLWQNATPADRSRFLRHLRTWWDVHRHRLPPSTAGRLHAARVAGQLRLHAGRILDAVPNGSNQGAPVRLTYLPRAATGPATLDAARLVNCTGPAADYARLPDPLIRNLLASGLARPDPLRLGLDITPSLALVRTDGTPSTRVFVLGPLLRATFWEMTSVPDLRVQAAQLAQHLAEQLSPACLAQR